MALRAHTDTDGHGTARASELERLVDLSVDMLCVATMAGRFLFVNPAWCLTLGYEEGELTGRSAIPFVHEEDRDRTVAEARRLSEPGAEVVDYESRFLHRDGSHRWLLWSARSDGNRIYAVARDVTERREADRAVRASEERYRNIIETSTEGVWMIDRDHRTTFANRRMAEMLGYSVEEMLGKPVAEFLLEDDHPRASRDGQESPREVRYRRKDGSEMWGLLSGSPLSDGDGVYGGALAMITDITDRKRSEEAVARLAAIVASSPDAIFSTDLEGAITSWNAAAERIYGYTEEEVLGRSAWLLSAPDHQAETAELSRRLSGGESVVDFLTIGVTKDGHTVAVAPSISPIHAPDGEVIGTLAIVRSVTPQEPAG